MDKDCIDELIALGTDPKSIAVIQDRAAKEMQRNGLGYTLHNACAATLSMFLQASKIDVPTTLGAGRLASRLEDDRHWERIAVGSQRAGDIGVTFDNTSPSGADHIYLVVERVDSDEMVIADNQAPKRHPRFASGHGKTPTDYFLRAGEQAGLDMFRFNIASLEYPEADEDTNGLTEPFEDNGAPM